MENLKCIGRFRKFKLIKKARFQPGSLIIKIKLVDGDLAVRHHISCSYLEQVNAFWSIP